MAARRTTQPHTPTRARARKPDWRKPFLEALAAGQTIKAAAADAGINRRTAYERRDTDAEFAAAWDDAYEDGSDLLEAEAWRRAVDGWVERGIYDEDGEQIGEVRKYSDTMLALLIKARRPAIYRERHQVEHTGPGGGPIEAQITVDAKEAADAARDFLTRVSGPDA